MDYNEDTYNSEKQVLIKIKGTILEGGHLRVPTLGSILASGLGHKVSVKLIL